MTLPVRIFDAHVHVDRGFAKYDLVDMGRNVIFNDVATYRAHRAACRPGIDATTIVVELGPEFAFVEEEVAAGRVHGLKIHSRVQRIDESAYALVAARLDALPARLPIVIDAFYYGRDLRFQPSLPAIVDLLGRFPDRRFVIAHCGGYRLLEFFFHLREFENCYYELSFALAYLSDSSLAVDLRKLLRFTDKARILYGSDHPYAGAAAQLRTLLAMCAELGLSEHDVDAIVYRNARTLFLGAA